MVDGEVPDVEIEVQVAKSKEKGAKGAGAFTTYAVSTKTTEDVFAGTSFTVVRRYRDFLWLQSELLDRYPGVIIPPLPEKREYNKFDAFFLQYRRRGLQKFLRTIAAHPRLARSSVAIEFLESETPLPSSKNLARDIFSKVTSFSMARLHAANLQENDEFSMAQDQLDHLSAGLKATASGLKAQARVFVDIADVLDGFSDEATGLAELSQPPLAQWITATGDGMYRVSLIDRELSTSVFETFGATLGEYVRGSYLARAALVARAEAYIKWQDTVAAGDAKRAALDKAREKPGKESAVAKLESKIDALDDKARGEVDLQHALVALTQDSITSHQKRRAIFGSILRSLQDDNPEP